MAQSKQAAHGTVCANAAFQFYQTSAKLIMKSRSTVSTQPHTMPLSDLRVILVSEKHGPVPRAAPLESLPTRTTKHWMYVNKRKSNERSECVYYL